MARGEHKPSACRLINDSTRQLRRRLEKYPPSRRPFSLHPSSPTPLARATGMPEIFTSRSQLQFYPLFFSFLFSLSLSLSLFFHSFFADSLVLPEFTPLVSLSLFLPFTSLESLLNNPPSSCRTRRNGLEI